MFMLKEKLIKRLLSYILLEMKTENVTLSCIDSYSSNLIKEHKDLKLFCSTLIDHSKRFWRSIQKEWI